MSSEVLKGIKPVSVFKFFEEISRIPRESGNEKEISDYLVKFAKERNLEVIQDSVNNVIIKKNGTAGYESAPTIIIQGHMDMVWEKNAGTLHDFHKDPIPLVVDGDMIRTNGTTLGADNGIAVAFGMALLDSKDISHPPLEVLMTTDEETGMSGAKGIEAKDIKGRILINIDSEEEGKLLVSCSGGLRSKIALPVEWEELEVPSIECNLKIRGLKGGHSGMDIDKERGNSNKIMGRVLLDLLDKVEYKLTHVSGGSKDNAIPREAEAKIYIDEKNVDTLRNIVDEWKVILKNEYSTSDPGLSLDVGFSTVNHSAKVLCDDSKIKAVKLLFMIPNGIKSMSLDIPGLVQSSTNLGIVATGEKTITFDNAVRSSVRSLKLDIAIQTKLIGEAYGAEVIIGSEYPEWQYNPESDIREIFQKVYKRLYNEEPEIIAIHAGVECGLFKEKFGDIDMISFGPNMYDVHTPDEHLSISSTEKTWDYLLEVLREIK